MDNPVSRFAIPPAAARGAKAMLGSFAGYGARALRRLPPRSAVSQSKAAKAQPLRGEIGRCAADVHITRHSAKSPRSLRCASLLGAIAPASPTRPSGLQNRRYVLRPCAAAKP